MTRDEVLEKLKTTRAEFDRRVSAIPPGRLNTVIPDGSHTPAQIIAHVTKAEFIEFSAVLAGIKEIKQVMADAEKARQWIARGATPSDTVQSLLKQAGVFKAATA